MSCIRQSAAYSILTVRISDLYQKRGWQYYPFRYPGAHAGSFDGIHGHRYVFHDDHAGTEPVRHFFHDAVPVLIMEGTHSGDNGKLINPVIEEQYDLIYGNWPTRYDEVVLFVDENNELDDLTLYALGLKSKDDIDAIFQSMKDQTEVDYPEEKWSYEDICNMDFRTILSSDCYTYDEMSGTYTDLRNTDAGLKYLYDNALTLHVVGIVKPDENALGLPPMVPSVIPASLRST